MQGASPQVATPGTFNVFGADQIFAQVKFVGGNSVGPQITMELTNVMFRPSNPIGLIQDEWGQLHLTGEVLADDTGIFGTVTHPDATLVSPLVDMYYIGKGIVSVMIPRDHHRNDALADVVHIDQRRNERRVRMGDGAENPGIVREDFARQVQLAPLVLNKPNGIARPKHDVREFHRNLRADRVPADELHLGKDLV